MTVDKLIAFLQGHEPDNIVRVFQNGTKYEIVVVREVEVDRVEVEEQL